MTTDKIEMKLVVSRSLTRVPCHICGGCTEKVNTWCEAETDDIRVCETCLQEGNIDERLREHAEGLERYAAHVRSLIGRLIVPTRAEWDAAEKKANDEDEAEYLKREAEYRKREAEREVFPEF